jgi:Holliday junction DNA helicase RuvB
MADLTNPAAESNELTFESALRPKSLDEFIGQHKVREQLRLVLAASKLQGRTADHVLLAGPPGLGKTTLALIVSAEANQPLRLSSGPAIQSAGDLASILSSLQPGEVLFIDEIHRMSKAAEEMLYLAMEDFRVDVMVGKGPGATSLPLEISPFTLVGATTRAGMLPGPLRDRFGFTANMEFYSEDELSDVIRRASSLLSLQIEDSAVLEISRRSRGTPRVANRLLRRVRDYAVVNDVSTITTVATRTALDLFEVDELGLDRLDRDVLKALVNKFAGRAVGLSTIAISVGEEQETIEAMVEPYLVRQGLIARTPRGRVATDLAVAHLAKHAN